MKKIFVDILIILVLLTIIDVVVGIGAREYMAWLNKTPRQGDAALVNYNLNAATPDIAVIGSSTAICHYDPDIISDSVANYTGREIEVFNMGMSRQRMAYNYYGLKWLCDRKIPKIVIEDVWASNLSAGDISKGFIEYRPYIKTNSGVKELFVNHGEYDFKLKSNLYCLNTTLVKLLLSSFRNGKANGYEVNRKEMQVFSRHNKKDMDEIAGLSKKEFDEMIELSKQNDFLLFVVLSPTLHSSDTTSLSYQYMKAKCLENRIPFLDYSNDSSYFDKHYFRDFTHMNSYGAEKFTSRLMNDIKPMILSGLKLKEN